MSAQSSAGFQPAFESLPPGWSMATLGAVVRKKVDQEEPSGTGTFRYIDIGSVDNALKIITEAKRLPVASAPSRARQKVAAGDVLVSMTRPNLNAVAVVPPEMDGARASTGFDVLRPTEAVLTEWLFLQVRARRFVAEMSALVQGALYPAVRPSDIRAFEFPLPPLAEQRRIVARLEALMARSRRARALLAEVPAQLAQARQSILSDATSGRLTKDWRDSTDANGTGADVVARDAELKSSLLESEPSLSKKKSTIESEINTEYVYEIPEGWVFSTWGKVSEWITYGFTRPMPASADGIKQVTAKDVLHFSLQLETSRFTTKEAFAELSEKDKPRRGDLLVTKDGTIGRAAIVDSDEPFCINQSVAVCWLRTTTMSKRYLEIVANADFTQRFIADHAQGMAIQHLSIADFSHCPLPVPPLTEQHEIVRRLSVAFARLDAAAAAHAAAVAELDRLDQSLLGRAFSGAL